MVVTGNNAVASMMLGVSHASSLRLHCTKDYRSQRRLCLGVLEGVFLLHQECDWLAQSLDACRTRSYEVGRVKIRVPHWEERPDRR